jgi:soluble lytic murein transglycosylase-like protein
MVVTPPDVAPLGGNGDPELPPLGSFLLRCIGPSQVIAKGRPWGGAPMARGRGSVAAPEQRVVADYIATRYHVSSDIVVPVVTTAYQAGAAAAVDPLLILAVIAIESSFNPSAMSFAGARGLMQVMPKYHMDKIGLQGGQELLFSPQANIHVGVKILREYLRRFGSPVQALQMYVGALDDPTSSYARRVMIERSLFANTIAHLRPDT